MVTREDIIRNYIECYNHFDVEGMIRDFDLGIVFKNIQGDQVTLQLEGVEAFIGQARAALGFFTERKQHIRSMVNNDDQTEVEIDYQAVLAMDFPNGMKKGDVMKMTAKSLFKFQHNKVISLTDIS